MSRDRRFFAGLIGVAAVVTWLVWTGISDTMVYYLTPSELIERVEASPALQDQGVKVSGDVVAGSYEGSTEELLHRFVVADPENPEVQLTVHFRHPLPDTFMDTGDVEVVMEGRYQGDGVFEATEVLTKCGSRYEALPEEMEGQGYGGP
jgi:cytochrome c-type biogenesis protein CcmE